MLQVHPPYLHLHQHRPQHHQHHPHQPLTSYHPPPPPPPPSPRNMAMSVSGSLANTCPPSLPRKRKAESQDHHERLSKRMSRLQLERERDGTLLSVRARERAAPPPTTTLESAHANNVKKTGVVDDTEWMQVDDTKHRVFIHNLDDELTSSSESETESDTAAGKTSAAARLRLHPDMERHLDRHRRLLAGTTADCDDDDDDGGRRRRPQPMMPGWDDAGSKQLILYRAPSPPATDCQKAVVQAVQARRDRYDQQQQYVRDVTHGLLQGSTPPPPPPPPSSGCSPAPRTNSSPAAQDSDVDMDIDMDDE